MISSLADAPEGARKQALAWRSILEPLLTLEHGVTSALREIAVQNGVPYKTVERKYYTAKRSGFSALIDRRKVGPRAWNTERPAGLSQHDQNLVKTYVERNQRKSATAIKDLRADWLAGKVHTDTPLDLATGYPRGWSEANLMRHLPNRFELTAARIGRSAAAFERRLVYTTRAELWVGSHFLFDDIWHDLMVNNLDQRKVGRPLEFHGLDLFSANKFAWGCRVRQENDGRMEGLKEEDMRFLLACVLGTHGYSERGTTLVVEHGTAAIRPDLEAILVEESGGLITINRSGMEGAAAAAHQYAGRPKGNFRLKAALESLGNLIHNMTAALPGQVGLDVDHRPEQMHGLLKRNDALLTALSELAPERAAMLRWDLLTIQQFRAIVAEIYQRMNGRTDHELEGWDNHYIPDRRSGYMRRLSPAEVWASGARHLRRFRPEAVAMILLRDTGVELTTRQGMFQLTNGEITGDVLRFDARDLKDREKFLTVLNPYDPTALYVFDARGRFVTAAPRIHSVNRAEIEAVQRACGEAAKAEAERLAPFRARHLAEARRKAADMRHNEKILAGRPERPTRLPAARDLDALTTSDEPVALPPAPEADDAGDLASKLADLI